ncbi:hypothetical protein ACFL2D_00255 [Patescibacteria group bacterium]
MRMLIATIKIKKIPIIIILVAAGLAVIFCTSSVFAQTSPATEILHDGEVNVTDLNIYRFMHGTKSEGGDLNKDGNADALDLALMMSEWSNTCVGCDEDNDGFKTLDPDPNLADCDDQHPRVHPYSREKQNRIDDDCDNLIDEGSAEIAEGVLQNDYIKIEIQGYDPEVHVPECFSLDDKYFGYDHIMCPSDVILNVSIKDMPADQEELYTVKAGFPSNVCERDVCLFQGHDPDSDTSNFGIHYISKKDEPVKFGYTPIEGSCNENCSGLGSTLDCATRAQGYDCYTQTHNFQVVENTCVAKEQAGWSCPKDEEVVLSTSSCTHNGQTCTEAICAARSCAAPCESGTSDCAGGEITEIAYTGSGAYGRGGGCDFFALWPTSYAPNYFPTTTFVGENHGNCPLSDGSRCDTRNNSNSRISATLNGEKITEIGLGKMTARTKIQTYDYCQFPVPVYTWSTFIDFMKGRTFSIQVSIDGNNIIDETAGIYKISNIRSWDEPIKDTLETVRVTEAVLTWKIPQIRRLVNIHGASALEIKIVDDIQGCISDCRAEPLGDKTCRQMGNAPYLGNRIEMGEGMIEMEPIAWKKYQTGFYLANDYKAYIPSQCSYPGE